MRLPGTNSRQMPEEKQQHSIYFHSHPVSEGEFKFKYNYIKKINSIKCMINK